MNSKPKPTLAARWKNPWTGLALLILVGLWFRVSTNVSPPLLSPDSILYLSMAQKIQSGEFFRSDAQKDLRMLGAGHLPPLYPLLLACFPGLDRFGDYVGLWLSIGFSLATFLPVFWLGRRLDSTASGFLAAGLLTFHGFVLSFANLVLTEATFTFFFGLAFALALRAMDRKTVFSFILTGLSTGLAYLTREAGMLSLFLIAGLTLIRFTCSERLAWRRTSALLVALFAGFILIAFPSWLETRVTTGRWTLSARLEGQSLWDQILLYGATRYDRDLLPEWEEQPKPLIPEPPETPAAFFRLLPRLAVKVAAVGSDYTEGFFRFFGRIPTLFCLFALLLSLGRVIAKPRAPDSLNELGFWIWFFHLPIFYGLFTPNLVDERYMYPMVVPGTVAAAFGLLRPVRWLSRRWPKLALGAVPAAGLLFLVLVFFELQPFLRDLYFQKTLEFRRLGLSYGYKEAAQELKRQGLVPPGKIFLARKPFLSYYLHGGLVLLPKTLEELQDSVSSGQADYLAVDSATLSLTRARLISLAFPDEIHPPWPIIYSQAFPQYGRIITLYDLKASGPEPDGSARRQTPEQHLAAAKDYLNRGRIFEGLREAKTVLAEDSENVAARALVMEGYQRYYRITQDGWILAKYLSAVQDYLKLNPNDRPAQAQLKQILNSFVEVSPGIYRQR